MLEIKYPFSHGLDGKIHKIKIKKIYNYNGKIILFGNENKNEVIIEIAYSYKILEWYMIPHMEDEINSIINNNWYDITEILKTELDGKSITNVDELDLNNKFQDNNIDKVLDGILSELKQDNLKIKKKSSYFILEDTPIKNSELYTLNKPKEKMQNINEIFSIYKNQSFNLISDYINNNTECQNITYAQTIMKLIENIFNCLLEIPDIIFTEDDLIDLGLLLNKLQFKKIYKISEKKFNEIINNGYQLIDNLKRKINIKRK